MVEYYKKATELKILLIEEWGLLAVARIDRGEKDKAEKCNPSEKKIKFLT